MGVGFVGTGEVVGCGRMVRRKGKQRRSTTRVQYIDLPPGGFDRNQTSDRPEVGRSGPGTGVATGPVPEERDDSGVVRVVDPMEELERERVSQRVLETDRRHHLDTDELADLDPGPDSGPDPGPGPEADSGPLEMGGAPEMEMDGDASIFESGTVLEGKFEIQHCVGRGAMGEVFLATDVNLKRSVAVKALSALHRSDEVVGRFRSEAESMARVDHPNVVKIYSFGTHEEKPYFVMEFLDGESLAEFIDRRLVMQEVVHLDEVIGLLSQVCRGLGTIHAQGIVHRDVKPANVMITTTYRVALADFGLVGMITDDESQEVAVYGTPVYIAPERFDSRPLTPDLAHSCDIYSLGIILYELLTGEAPFDHDDTMTLLGMHATAVVPRASRLRPDIPPAIDDVIRKAMAKDPEDRHESAEAFRRALLDARETGMSLEAIENDFTALVVEPDAKAAVSKVRAVKMAHPAATVLTVADGDMALVFIREMRPELIILDGDAPGLNALELCALLQEEKLLVGSQVVVLTPRADSVEARYLKELGVTEVLQKPISGPQLVKVIRA
jgi:eukaryotic-like serine/threonine-protein kinase